MPETIGQRHYGAIRIRICCTKESMHTSMNLRNLKNGSVSILRLSRFKLNKCFALAFVSCWPRLTDQSASLISQYNSLMENDK